MLQNLKFTWVFTKKHAYHYIELYAVDFFMEFISCFIITEHERGIILKSPRIWVFFVRKLKFTAFFNAKNAYNRELLRLYINNFQITSNEKMWKSLRKVFYITRTFYEEFYKVDERKNTKAVCSSHVSYSKNTHTFYEKNQF